MKKTLSRIAPLLALFLLSACGAEPVAPAQTTARPGDPEPPLFAQTAAPEAPAIVAGEYVYTDASVLTVEEDGSLTYEPVVSGFVTGVPVMGQVLFTGSVDAYGNVTLEKAYYHGIDLLRAARRNGVELERAWIDYAESMYDGLQAFGSINLLTPEAFTQEQGGSQ